MSDSDLPTRPLLRVALRSADPSRVEDLRSALSDLVRQNPTLTLRSDAPEQFLLCGFDEASLESASQRVVRESGIRIDVGDPEVLYIETIRKTAEAEGKYIRQTGGSGNYGHCKLRVEPNTPGAGYEFINDIKDGDIKGGVVPKEYIKPIDQGVQAALELGILAGFPIVDVKVTLFDGSYHEVDSNEMAFKFAGSIGFKDAARKASPVLLEPVMAVEVTVPEEFMGTIIGDINSRRGRIEGMERRTGLRLQVIHAVVPLAEMLRLRSPDRERYRMRFLRYEEVRNRGETGESGPGITAIKPGGPKSRGRSGHASS